MTTNKDSQEVIKFMTLFQEPVSCAPHKWFFAPLADMI
jgi:hypothetical protein